jgi:D-lactate dehydrogenase (cytochrome)
MFAHSRAVDDRLVRRALTARSTCTGEHGIGLGNAKFMREEHGDVCATP